MLSKSHLIETFSRELIFIMDKEGSILELSQNFNLILGYPKEKIIGTNIRKLMINTDIIFKNNQSVNLILKNSNDEALCFDGHINHLLDGEDEVYLLSAVDITDYLTSSQKDEKRIINDLREQLERLSYYDSLTGLYNRNFIEYEMDKLNLLDDVPLGMIICDLDNLKIINDTYGHSEGDYLLQQAAGIIKEPLSDNMPSGRIGGDEFIVLLKNVSREKVKEIYEKITLGVKNHNKNAPRIAVEISIGYAHTESSIGATKELFRIADKLMYLDKREKQRHNKEFLVSHVI